jgi:hypothetical protein
VSPAALGSWRLERRRGLPEITLHVYHNSDARQLWQLPAIDDFVRRIAGLTTIIYAAFTDEA